MKIIGSLLVLSFFAVIDHVRTVDKNCVKKVWDIILLLDSSDSVSTAEFEQAKIALVNLLSYFLITPTDTRVSLVGYGTKPMTDFKFAKYMESASMNFAVRLHRKIGGKRSMGEALTLALTDVIPEMRNNVERVMIVVSGGSNTDNISTKLVASKIKAKNVSIYSVGINAGINISEMVDISSDKRVITYPNILNLQKDLQTVVNAICVEPFITKMFTTSSKPFSTSKFTTSKKTEPRKSTASKFPKITTNSVNITRKNSNQTHFTTKSINSSVASKKFTGPVTNTRLSPNSTMATKRFTINPIFTSNRTESRSSKKSTFKPTVKPTFGTTTSHLVEVSTPDQDCNHKKIDLIFALDASSSLARYWDQELVFTNNIINSLQIGLKYSLVGVLLYSDLIEMSVPLGSVLNKTALQSQIRKLQILEGATFIANALHRCKEEFNTKGREGVKKTIILVTDGADNSIDLKPDVEADKIKKLGIKIIVTGLGYSIIKDDLNKLSSSETYYPIENMSQLALFNTSELSQDACHVDKPKRICNAKLDIILIIDASSQVPNKEWVDQLLFAKKFINLFDLGINTTRFSIITFANDAVIEEQFTTIYSDLTNRLESLKYIGGLTRIDKALDLASKSFYLKSKNARKLVVLLSNGLSKERVQSIGVSYDLQETGAQIMTIGLGEKADREEMRILASHSLSFMRKDVKQEQTLLENSVKAACIQQPNVKTNICSAKGDIIFIIDKSTDQSDESWEGIKSLILTTLHSLNVSKEGSRVSIIVYSAEAKAEFRLDEFFTKRDVYVAVRQLRREGNGGDLASAIRRARQIFEIDNRITVAKIVVLFTDKLPNNQKGALAEAENLKVDGTHIVYVGLSKTSPYTFYEELASKKSSVKVDNINQIEKHKEQIRNLICDVFKNKQDECSMKKLDVIFAIDKSTSLGPENFQIELDFINRIIGNLDLRKDRTRVGVFTFNTFVDLHIPLNSNMDASEMQKKITKIPFIEGMTAIGLVIGNATQHFLEHGYADVPKVLVVLTDGSNTDGVSPQIPAVAAKRAGIKIISVGVGGLISEKELKDISTSGELYNIRNFKDLEKYNAKTISNDACQIPQKPTICKAAGDLIYILGSGADKNTERFKQMADFMKGLTKLTFVDRNSIRVAILKFNRGNYIDSGFQENYASFEKSIEDMTSSTNGVYIGKPLEKSRLLFESDTRSNATKTVIIVSDSHITDRNETFQEAEKLKKMGVKIFTIGLTGKVSDSDLKMVASPEKALFVENFDNLQKYNAYISSELCEVIKGTDKECSNKQLEVMFALDSSSSIGPAYWKDELHFVERIVKDMDISDTLTRVGVVTFNTYSRKEFGLDKYTDKYAILSAVKSIEFEDGATAIGDALRECKWELMNNSRRDVPKLILLVTDGKSTGGISPEIESTIIKKLGIKIAAIGIGDSISPSQLKALSTSGTYYRILDFKSLNQYDTTFITRDSCKTGKES